MSWLSWCCVTVAAAAGSVAAQNSKVVPADAAQFDGNWACFLPFAHGVTHTQQVWEGAAIATQRAVLTGIAMRAEPGLTPPGVAFKMKSLTVSFGPTAVGPQTMSTSFASNRTAPMTVVFQGDLDVPMASADHVLVSPMNIRLPFQQSFAYGRGAGDLLMEMMTGGRTILRTQSFVDAVVNGGAARSFGVNGPLPEGALEIVSPADPLNIVPGGTLTVVTTTGGRAYGGVVALGASNTAFLGVQLPWSMAAAGAPANFLYVSPDVTLPLTPTVVVPIPPRPEIVGQFVFAQSLLLVPGANPLGVVTSRGLAFRVGDPAADPPTRAMGTPYFPTPTGGFANTTRAGTGGPVVEFSGMFQ